MNLFVNNQNDSITDEIDNTKKYFKDQSIINSFNNPASIFSTDNNSNISPNFQKSPQKNEQKVTNDSKNNNKINQNISFGNNKSSILNQKRNRVEDNKYQKNNIDFTNIIENFPLNSSQSQKVNFAILNPENYANLQNMFPNSHTQNMELLNWVLPGELLNNNNINSDHQREDKL